MWRVPLLVLVSVFLCFGSSSALLWDRGSGLIYDNVLDVTWMQDANYAKSSGFDSDGYTTWSEAMAWADSLSYYDSDRDISWDDWRLPDAHAIDGSGPFSGNSSDMS